MLTVVPTKSLLLIIDFQSRLMPSIDQGTAAVKNAKHPRFRDAIALPRFSQSVSSEFPEVRGKGDPSGLMVGGLGGLVD